MNLDTLFLVFVLLKSKLHGINWFSIHHIALWSWRHDEGHVRLWEACGMVNFMLEFRKRTLKRAKECPTIEMVGKGHVGLMWLQYIPIFRSIIMTMSGLLSFSFHSSLFILWMLPSSCRLHFCYFFPINSRCNNFFLFLMKYVPCSKRNVTCQFEIPHENFPMHKCVTNFDCIKILK